MSRRVVALVLATAAAVLVPACGARSESGLGPDERKEALERSAHAPRRFTYERASAGVRTGMIGDVEDDYRYRVLATAAEQPQYEEVTVDDHRAVRVVSAGAVPEPLRADPLLSPLLAGGWVADAAPAPGEFRKLDAPVRLLDPTPVLDQVRFLERLATDPAKLRLFRAAGHYDPKSTSYLRRNDKFPPHEDWGVRYDVVPGSFDLDRIFENGVPPDLAAILDSVALYQSFWFKGGRVTRLERFLHIDDQAVGDRIRRAVAGNAKRAGVPVANLPVPPTPHPYREVYTFRYGPPEAIALPATTATVVLPVLPSGP